MNIDNNFFDSMVNRIYPTELQLNKANVSDAETSFLNLHLSISDGFIKTKIYDKRDDFDFDIVNFPFLDGDNGSVSEGYPSYSFIKLLRNQLNDGREPLYVASGTPKIVQMMTFA